jgi:hypothetical protein
MGLAQAYKTTCPKGHPYAGDNLIVRRNGYRGCRACHNLRTLLLQRKNAGSTKNADKCKQWRAENPEKASAYKARIDKVKLRARALLSEAARKGRISKPDKCAECGESKSLHGHHEDYTQPFKVEWLCRTCHSKRHRKDIYELHT